MKARIFHAFSPMTAELTLLVVGLAALTFAPPARGQMLLVPMTQGAAARLPALAIRDDVRLIGRGPFAGSLVVEAERANIAERLLRSGVLPLAAPAILCGKADPGES